MINLETTLVCRNGELATRNVELARRNELLEAVNRRLKAVVVKQRTAGYCAIGAMSTTSSTLDFLLFDHAHLLPPDAVKALRKTMSELRAEEDYLIARMES